MYDSYPAPENEDAILLAEAWADVTKIQQQLDTIPAGTPEVIQTAVNTVLIEYQDTLSRIYRHCEGNYITATGDQMCFPVINEETGELQGMTIGVGGFKGRFCSVDIHNIQDQLMIGISLVYLPPQTQTTPVSKTGTTYVVFAPFVHSTYHVHEEDFLTPLPEEDDEVAMDIDEALLSKSIDFPKLIALFQDPSKEWSDLQEDVYLRYLNKIATFRHITALAPYGLKIESDSGHMGMYESEEGLFLLDGEFDGFQLAVLQGEDGILHSKLLVAAVDPKGNRMSVIAEDITDIQLK